MNGEQTVTTDVAEKKPVSVAKPAAKKKVAKKKAAPKKAAPKKAPAKKNGAAKAVGAPKGASIDVHGRVRVKCVNPKCSGGEHATKYTGARNADALDAACPRCGKNTVEVVMREKS